MAFPASFLALSWVTRGCGHPRPSQAIPGPPRPSQASTVEDDLGSLALFRPLYALRAPVGGIPWGTRDWQGPGAILVMNPYPHPHPHPHHYSSLPRAQIQFPSGLGISWASKTCSFLRGKFSQAARSKLLSSLALRSSRRSWRESGVTSQVVGSNASEESSHEKTVRSVKFCQQVKLRCENPTTSYGR